MSLRECKQALANNIKPIRLINEINHALELSINSIANFKTGSALYLISLATERAPSQEIPLHTVLLICILLITTIDKLGLVYNYFLLIST